MYGRIDAGRTICGRTISSQTYLDWGMSDGFGLGWLVGRCMGLLVGWSIGFSCLVPTFVIYDETLEFSPIVELIARVIFTTTFDPSNDRNFSESASLQLFF